MRVTHLSLATVALALLACADSPESDSSIGSRLARAATRTIVDVVREIDTKSSDIEARESAPEPLRLAASRPDAILGHSSTKKRQPDEVTSPTPHVVIATTLPDFSRCREALSALATREVRSADGMSAGAACPLPRVRTASLTRI